MTRRPWEGTGTEEQVFWRVLHVRRKGAHEVAWLFCGLLAVREHVKYATWSEAFIKLYKQIQTKSKMVTEII